MAATRPRGRSRRGARLVLAGQLCLVGGLVVGALVEPWVYLGPPGVSRLGTSWPGVLPYSVGLAGAATCTLLAARDYAAGLPPARAAGLRRSLRVLAALLVLVLVGTYPYRLHPVLDALHRLAGGAYVGWALLLAARLVAAGGPDPLGRALLAVPVAGAALMLVALLTPAAFLSSAQVVFAVGLAASVARSTLRLPH